MARKRKKQQPVFVTEDRGIKQPCKLDPTDIEILRSAEGGRGVVLKSTQELQGMAEAACATFEDFREQARQMTKDQVALVRKLRIELGYSWRAVARACHEQKWPGWEWNPPSNQIMGMALCERAAQLYGEDYMKPPWN